MLTEQKNARPAITVGRPTSPDDEALRRTAVHQAERIRNLKLHAAMFAVGMPVVTGIWALTEYLNADGWPERFSESAGEGNWNPWIVWVFLIWGGLLAIQAVRTYVGRPPTDAEVEQELKRLRARG
ncbi:MAG TPA: 2TM domain-containing protein [Gaiellaceae bacterium]|jgi:hypothetical protein